MSRPWDDDTRDSGIIPGGIRDRVMRAMMQRGPRPEDPKKTQASRDYWVAQYPTTTTKKED
jgi:hypothetical protein